LPAEFKAALDALMPASLEAIARAIHGKNPDLALRAANIVLNRKYGIPKQTIEQTGDPTILIVTDAIKARMDEASARHAEEQRPETE